VGGINYEVEINIHPSPYVKQIDNMALLYRTGNSTQLTKLEAKEVWSITDIFAEVFQQNFSEETDPHTRPSNCQGWSTVLGSLTVGLLSVLLHTGHLTLSIARSSDPGGYWGQGPQWALSSESWVPRSTPSSIN